MTKEDRQFLRDALQASQNVLVEFYKKTGQWTKAHNQTLLNQLKMREFDATSNDKDTY